MPVECPSCGSKEELSPSGDFHRCERCGAVIARSEPPPSVQATSERVWKTRGDEGLPVSLRVLRYRIKTGKLTAAQEISRDGDTWQRVDSHPNLKPLFSGACDAMPAPEQGDKNPGAVSEPAEKPVKKTSRDYADFRTASRRNGKGLASSVGFASFTLFAAGAFFLPVSNTFFENRRLTEENRGLENKLSVAESRIAGLEKKLSRLDSEFAEVKSSGEEFKRAKEILEDIKKSIDSNRIYLAVSLAENRLYVKSGTKTLKKYVVSTGKGWARLKGTGRIHNFLTPRGRRVIKAKEKNPVWYKPDWAWAEAGIELPENISIEDRAVRGQLGKYRLKLGGSYAIHGTKDGTVEGTKETHGCIRMGRKDLKELYAMVRAGTEVYIY